MFQVGFGGRFGVGFGVGFGGAMCWVLPVRSLPLAAFRVGQVGYSVAVMPWKPPVETGGW